MVYRSISRCQLNIYARIIVCKGVLYEGGYTKED